VVVDSQQALQQLFKDGQLQKDFVAVVRCQGPQANGMPELHKLTPMLGVLQDQGFQVALVTDGRMSGASGKVPAAIHVSPEAVNGGVIGVVQNGDMITLDCDAQTLTLEIGEDARRARPALQRPVDTAWGSGRGLFALFRQHAALAEEGASPLLSQMPDGKTAL
jgi:phosphogluconate dehydratase